MRSWDSVEDGANGTDPWYLVSSKVLYCLKFRQEQIIAES